MDSKDPKPLKISSDSSLLQIRSLTMSGDYYRVILGKKELTTYDYLERPEHTDNMVLYTEERFAGEADTRYTLNKIEVSSITRRQMGDDEKGNSFNQPFESDFDFKEFGNYQMRGFVFNYQIVPTLNKGPKLTKSFITPTHLFTIKGYLSDHIKAPIIDPFMDTTPPEPLDIGDNPIPPIPPPEKTDGIPEGLKTNFIPNASSLRKTINQNMEHHISL